MLVDVTGRRRYSNKTDLHANDARQGMVMFLEIFVYTDTQTLSWGIYVRLFTYRRVKWDA